MCKSRHYANESGPVPVPVRASGPDIAPGLALGLIIFFGVTCGFVGTMQFVGFVLLLISYICVTMMIIMEYAKKAGIEDGYAAMSGIVGFVVISVILTDMSSFGLVSKEFPERCAIVVGIIFTYWLLNQCYKEYK